MQPCDVIVRLAHQDWHIMRRGKGPSFLIGGRRPAKIIKAHVCPSHIVQRHPESFAIVRLVKREKFVGTLVALQSLPEAVLAVEDIAEIQVQPCDAPSISLCRENLARFPRSRKS